MLQSQKSVSWLSWPWPTVFSQLHLWLRWLVIALLVCGIIVRFVNLDGKFYWNDEAITSLRISGYRIDDVKALFDGRVISFGDLQALQQPKPNATLIDTLDSLAIEDAKHPPLYFVLVRAWSQLFGYDIATVRAFSALVSVATLPALYWLCWELFQSRAIAWLAIGLMAMSPFHILYAQEARAYSLWTLAILLSSAALLRSLRVSTFANWLLYAGTVAMGFYTQTLFAIVVIAQGAYVLITEKNRGESNRRWFPQSWIAYGLALAIGVGLFLPWFWNIPKTMPMLAANTGWVTESIPLMMVVKQWILGFSSIYFDLDPLALVKIRDGSDQWSDYLPRIPILALLIYAIVFVRNHTKSINAADRQPANSPQSWLFLVLLISAPIVFLAIPDVVLGGQRSSVPRYWISCYLGFHIAVTYLLATKLSLKPVGTTQIWKWMTLMIVGLQVASCTVSLSSSVWWNKHLYDFSSVADVINQAERPLVISDPTGANPGCLLALSHLLKPDVSLQLIKPPEVPPMPEGFSTVFLFDAYGKAYGSLQQVYTAQGMKTQPVTEEILWQMTIRQ